MEERGKGQGHAKPKPQGNKPTTAQNNNNNNNNNKFNSQLKQAKQYEREFQRLSKIKDMKGLRNYAATKIQAVFRRHKEGRKALAMKNQFTRNAKKIQRYWRKYVGGRNESETQVANDAA